MLISIGGTILSFIIGFLFIALLKAPIIAFFILPIGLLFSMLAAHPLSLTNATIKLIGNEGIEVTDKFIDFNKVEGYYLNDTGMTMTSLSIKISNSKPVSITGLKLGSSNADFQSAIDLVIKSIKLNCPDYQELAYQDVHTGQMKILRPIIVICIILIGLLDIAILLGFLTGTFEISLKLLFANGLILGLIPFLKRPKSP